MHQVLQCASCITKCDILLSQSASVITKCERLLLQSALGISKCDSCHKVRCNFGCKSEALFKSDSNLKHTFTHRKKPSLLCLFLKKFCINTCDSAVLKTTGHGILRDLCSVGLSKSFSQLIASIFIFSQLFFQ